MSKVLKHFPTSIDLWYASAPYWAHDTAYTLGQSVKVKDPYTGWWPYTCIVATGATNKHPLHNNTEWQRVSYVQADVPWGNFVDGVDIRAWDINTAGGEYPVFDIDDLAGAALALYDKDGTFVSQETIATNTASSTHETTITVSGGSWGTSPTFEHLILIRGSGEGAWYVANIKTAGGYVLEKVRHLPWARAIFAQIMPDQNFKLGHTPDNIRTKFGNGYQQVSPKGIHNDLAKFQARFGKLTQRDAEAIRNFLIEHNATPFYFFTPAPDWGRRSVIVNSWDVTYDTYNVGTVVMSVEEVAGYLTY